MMTTCRTRSDSPTVRAVASSVWAGSAAAVAATTAGERLGRVAGVAPTPAGDATLSGLPQDQGHQGGHGHGEQRREALKAT